MAVEATVETTVHVPLERLRGKRKTISVKRLSKRELDRGRLLFPEVDVDRPRRREECEGGERPCPFVSCKYHLYLDVDNVTGSIKLNFPELEVEELPKSCALDVADCGGDTLDGVGEAIRLTRERVRQLEQRALNKIYAAAPELFAEVPE